MSVLYVQLPRETTKSTASTSAACLRLGGDSHASFHRIQPQASQNPGRAHHNSRIEMCIRDRSCLIPLASFVLGLVIGSFLNVCICRLPLGGSIVGPGSSCPHCGGLLAAQDLVPVVSYVMLGGKLSLIHIYTFICHSHSRLKGEFYR